MKFKLRPDHPRKDHFVVLAGSPEKRVFVLDYSPTLSDRERPRLAMLTAYTSLCLEHQQQVDKLVEEFRLRRRVVERLKGAT